MGHDDDSKDQGDESVLTPTEQNPSESDEAIDPHWFEISEPMAIDDFPLWHRRPRKPLKPRPPDNEPGSGGDSDLDD